jgi:hypothetical protein
MIYLGENWPEKYRNTFFTVNIHGHRVNNDALVRQGSGYIAKHSEDFMRVDDTWFRGVSVVPANDGGVFVSDWSDAGECHDYEDIHRENGRIYKIQYLGAKKSQPDIRKLSDNELVALQSAKDEWLVSQSRLVLQERAEARNLQPVTSTRLRELFRNGAGPHDRLRGLWASHAVGRTPRIEEIVSDPDEYVRAWTIQLALEQKSRGTSAAPHLQEMAKNDESPVVRLYLASALQKLPKEERVPVARGLVQHGEGRKGP